MIKRYRSLAILLLLLVASIGLTLPASAQQPNITLSKTSVNVTEGSTTDTYTVVLDSQPTADVTVNVTGNADATVSPASLIFTPANWNTAQTVTVTAFNDRIYEASETATIGHSSSSTDPAYNGLSTSLTVNVSDNEFIVFGVARADGDFNPTSVSEGVGTVNFNIVITINAPGGGTGNYGFTQPFSIGYSVTGGTATLNEDYTFTAGSASFEPSSSLTSPNVFIPFTISVIDDGLIEGNETITFAVADNESGTTGGYANGIFRTSFPPYQTHTATITNNDVAGVTLSETSVSVAEGGATDTYTVRLNSQPTADVTVNINGGAQTTVNPASLTFTSANWNVAQTVTVTAVDDTMAESAHSASLTHTASSTDTSYDGITVASVTANITDNDAGVTLSETSVNVTEGGATDTYTVVLRSQPTADVTVSINGGAQTTVNPTSLTFTNANWNVAQTVTVSATNDAVAEGGHGGTITHTTASADASYNGLTVVNVTAVISDNDEAGITLSTSSVSATEGGSTDTYTIVLRSQPTANVTVNINGGAQTTVNPTSLTFTSANWNVAQNVTVTAVDDTVAESAHSATLTHTSASTDANYNGVGVASVTANITDNDSAGVSVTGSPVSMTEGGATDTYTVVLNTQPTADVIVSIQEGGNGRMGVQVAPSTGSLTFTSANWNVAQTVTVTAVDDTVVEGAHSATLTHTATSTDTNYNGITVASVTANIADNDALPSNLLLNNGFETALGDEWIGSNLVSNDRRACNSGTFAGVCLFRFNNSAASATFRTLSQTVTSTGWGVAGDTLNFAAQAQAIGFTGAMRMVIEVTYTDDTTARQRVLLPTGSYVYGQQVVSITLTKPLASVTVSFEARNDTGIMRFDNARLRLIAGAPPAAPLPLPLPDPQ